MSTKNLVLFACIVLASLGGYTLLTVVVQLGFLPKPKAVQSGLPALVIAHFIVSYGVLVAAGAALCAFLNSVVPLRWCLALGLLFAALHLAPFVIFYSRPEVIFRLSNLLFNLAIALGYVIAPIMGGYLVKRSRKLRSG